MNEYIYKETVDTLVNKFLVGLEINKDYIIAGGFVRDSLLHLEPKDIDVFVDNKVFLTELDFEMFVADKGGRIKITGTSNQYTNPTPSVNESWAPVWRVVTVAGPDPINSWRLSSDTPIDSEEPVRDLQMGREIHRTYDVTYENIFFTVNFIFTTIDKGFTPENLVNTFDNNLVAAYIANDLSLVPHKTFEESKKKKVAYIWTDGASSKEVDKSISRFIRWADRARKTFSWKYDLRNRNITTVDKVKKYLADGPYKSFINRNGKPFKDEQLKAYASAMPMR